VSEAALEAYLPTLPEDARETVRILAAAVEAAGEAFDCKITYRMLVYTFDARWHQWVVAIGVTGKAVNLRFLQGRQLEAPEGMLRPGSTTAAQVDYHSLDEVEPATVTALVRQAAALHQR
jgi:hypothetical protein